MDESLCISLLCGILFYLMNQLLDQNNIGPIIYYNVTRIWNFDENSQFENK